MIGITNWCRHQLSGILRMTGSTQKIASLGGLFVKLVTIWRQKIKDYLINKFLFYCVLENRIEENLCVSKDFSQVLRIFVNLLNHLAVVRDIYPLRTLFREWS